MPNDDVAPHVVAAKPLVLQGWNAEVLPDGRVALEIRLDGSPQILVAMSPDDADGGAAVLWTIAEMARARTIKERTWS